MSQPKSQGAVAVGSSTVLALQPPLGWGNDSRNKNTRFPCISTTYASCFSGGGWLVISILGSKTTDKPSVINGIFAAILKPLHIIWLGGNLWMASFALRLVNGSLEIAERCPWRRINVRLQAIRGQLPSLVRDINWCHDNRTNNNERCKHHRVSGTHIITGSRLTTTEK